MHIFQFLGMGNMGCGHWLFQKYLGTGKVSRYFAPKPYIFGNLAGIIKQTDICPFLEIFRPAKDGMGMPIPIACPIWTLECITQLHIQILKCAMLLYSHTNEKDDVHLLLYNINCNALLRLGESRTNSGVNIKNIIKGQIILL